MFINLKPRDERDASASEIIDRLRPKLAAGAGHRAVHAGLAGHQCRRPGSAARNISSPYRTATSTSSTIGRRSCFGRLQGIPLLRDVATDQQIAGPTLRLEINRDAASRLGVATQAIDDTLYDAFGQRKIAQFFTQQNNYWVVLEVDPRFQLDPNALDLIYVPSTSGEQVPLSALVERKRTVRSLSVSHQGQFPAITLSFNLAAGAALGQAVEAIDKVKARPQRPGSR